MKNQPKLLAVLTAAALSAGCASGGGSGGGGNPMVVDTAEEQFLCMLVPLFCLFGNDAGSPSAQSASAAASSSAATSISAAPPYVPPVPFTSWSDLPWGVEANASTLTTSMSYQSKSNGPIDVTFANNFHEGTSSAKYTEDGYVQYFAHFSAYRALTTLEAIGQ